MRRIIRSAQSEKDLAAVWRYIAADNVAAASALLERVDQRIQQLPEFPFIGERQPKFGANTRRIIEGNYLIFYEVSPDAIYVLRVYHSSRKLDDFLDP
jgi:toxin ParE1/3/4